VLLTQPSAQQRTSVGRQQSSCLQRTSHVSLLVSRRLQSFPSFGFFGAKTKNKQNRQSLSFSVVFALNISPCFVPFPIKVPIRVSEIRQCKLKNWKELRDGCEKRKPKIKKR
jgi:hypothetical protein